MQQSDIALRNLGYCPICQEETVFMAMNPWLRDYYQCLLCNSLPRERAIMRVINDFYPDWKQLIIHESSPAPRGTSVRLSQDCKQYISSQFFSDVLVGEYKDGILSENLEHMSFLDSSIDLHITQDVLEHIFNPVEAFKEIARTLKPGGAHIFTVPITSGYAPTECCAQLDNEGNVSHLKPPVYHGNPIDNSGSLVTFDWGYDIVELIWSTTQLPTYIIRIDDISNGIRAEYNDIFVTRKPLK